MYDEQEDAHLWYVQNMLQQVKQELSSTEGTLQILEDLISTLRAMHNAKPCPHCGGAVSIRKKGSNGLPEIFCLSCGKVLLTGYAEEKNLVEAWNNPSSIPEELRKKWNE